MSKWLVDLHLHFYMLLQVIQEELYRNLGLAILSIAVVTLILLADILVSLVVLTCVVFTLVSYQNPKHWTAFICLFHFNQMRIWLRMLDTYINVFHLTGGHRWHAIFLWTDHWYCDMYFIDSGSGLGYRLLCTCWAYISYTSWHQTRWAVLNVPQEICGLHSLIV